MPSGFLSWQACISLCRADELAENGQTVVDERFAEAHML